MLPIVQDIVYLIIPKIKKADVGYTCPPSKMICRSHSKGLILSLGSLNLQQLKIKNLRFFFYLLRFAYNKTVFPTKMSTSLKTIV